MVPLLYRYLKHTNLWIYFKNFLFIFGLNYNSFNNFLPLEGNLYLIFLIHRNCAFRRKIEHTTIMSEKELLKSISLQCENVANI